MAEDSIDSRPRIMMISTHGYVAAAPEFGKPDTGGQVVYVLELSKCLARMGFQVDILTRQFEDQPRSEEVEPGVQVLRFPCGGPDFIPKETLYQHIPQWVEQVLRYISESGYEYQFINSHYWDAGLAGQLLADELSIPHVHTPHSLGSWKRDNMDGDPAELEKRYNFQCRIDTETDIFQRCDSLVATTPQQREIVCDGEYHVDPAKVHVIPPGYDDTRFYPVSLATRQTLKQKIGVTDPLVLALGRMARNKGYDLLVRSFPSVLASVPEAKLMLAVGSKSPSQDELEMIQQLRDVAAELGIAESVIFADYIPDSELPDYYRAADVFALSSRYEPFGMTAIEAMACGTPTVVTTEGGLWQELTWGVETIYENPFVPESFGHAIGQILKYPEVSQQISQNGAQKARSSFTWTCIAQQLLHGLELRAEKPRPSSNGFAHEESLQPT